MHTSPPNNRPTPPNHHHHFNIIIVILVLLVACVCVIHLVASSEVVPAGVRGVVGRSSSTLGPSIAADRTL